MKWIFALPLLLSFSTLAQYRYVIYTDQQPPSRAQEVRDFFQNTPPFSEFHFEMEIRSMMTDELACQATEGIPRLVVCDTRTIMDQAYYDNFDQAFVVSDSEAYGGSGGAIPVITSSNSVPISTMIHEYMHVLGFCDEYIYSAQDLETFDYCSPNFISNAVNAVEITPLEEGYTGDQQARATHARSIPWYRHIQETTPIATQSLGTPGGQSNEIGLFPSMTCQNSSREIHLWKPGHNTIMSNLNDPIGPLVPLLREALLSIGLRPISPEGEEASIELRSTSNTANPNCNTTLNPSILSQQNTNHLEKITEHLEDNLNSKPSEEPKKD
jgi:hypothetical protein